MRRPLLLGAAAVLGMLLVVYVLSSYQPVQGIIGDPVGCEVLSTDYPNDGCTPRPS